MAHAEVDRLRERTLRIGVVFLAGIFAAAAVAVRQLPGAQAWEWGLLLAMALIVLAIGVLSLNSRLRQNPRFVVRASVAIVVLAALAVIQRVYSLAHGPVFQATDLSVFRPVLAFLPVLYIVAFALLPARLALTAGWLLLALICTIAVTGLYLATGLTLQRDGELALLLYLGVGNPLILGLMGLLPRYEDALRDSEQQKAVMQERADLSGQLAASEQRFKLVVQSLQVGAWDRDVADGDQRWWSERFYELLGYTPEELPASDQSLASIIHPQDRDTAFGDAARQLDERGHMDVDFRMMTAEQGYRWFNSVAKAQMDGDGNVLRLAGAIADIHDRKLAQQQLEKAQRELEHLAYRDPLTELYNRRYFNEQFERELQRCKRSGKPISLLMLDLDFFKAYNDCYGHNAGDACLVDLAGRLQSAVFRPSDCVARIGGEEFAMLLPETDVQGVRNVAQRAQEALSTRPMLHQKSPLRQVTASIGMTTLDDPEQPASVEYLLGQADRAMYQVKEQGRNNSLHYRDLAPASPQPEA